MSWDEGRPADGRTLLIDLWRSCTCASSSPGGPEGRCTSIAEHAKQCGADITVTGTRGQAGRRPAAGIGHDAPAARRAVPGRRRPVQRAGRDRRAKGRHDCL